MKNGFHSRRSRSIALGRREPLQLPGIEPERGAIRAAVDLDRLRQAAIEPLESEIPNPHLSLAEWAVEGNWRALDGEAFVHLAQFLSTDHRFSGFSIQKHPSTSVAVEDAVACESGAVGLFGRYQTCAISGTEVVLLAGRHQPSTDSPTFNSDPESAVSVAVFFRP